MTLGAWTKGAALTLAVLFGQTAATGAQERLVVGVRADARPFSFHADPNARGGEGLPRALGFDGYMVQLCDSILQVVQEGDGISGGIVVETRVVEAANRFTLLESGAVHILCDPATIVSSRLETALASTPVYMSAVSFAAPEDLPRGAWCRVMVGLVGETTATQGAREIERRGGWPRYGIHIRPALEAMAAGEEPIFAEFGGQRCDQPVVRFYRTHTELAERFCRGEILFYVGDIEIIRASIEQANCGVSHPVRPAIYSDERYAIYTALPQANVPTDAILLFLAELSRQVHRSDEDSAATGSILVDLFNEINEERRASEKLATFFWALTGQFPQR